MAITTGEVAPAFHATTCSVDLHQDPAPYESLDFYRLPLQAGLSDAFLLASFLISGYKVGIGLLNAQVTFRIFTFNMRRAHAPRKRGH
jgi:hypothetical protein